MAHQERPPSLAEAIAQARAELEQARVAGLGQEVQFQVTEMELELTVDVAKSAGADAGVRFWVVSVGAKGEIQRGDTNRVRVKLKPTTALGEDLRVGSEQAKRPDYGEKEMR
jgi:hypothetical protein